MLSAFFYLGRGAEGRVGGLGFGRALVLVHGRADQVDEESVEVAAEQGLGGGNGEDVGEDCRVEAALQDHQGTVHT